MCMQHEEVRTQDGVVTCRPSVIPTLTTTANSAARIVIWPRVHTLAEQLALEAQPQGWTARGALHITATARDRSMRMRNIHQEK